MLAKALRGTLKKKLIWETDWKHVNLISALFWKMDLKMDLKMDWY